MDSQHLPVSLLKYLRIYYKVFVLPFDSLSNESYELNFYLFSFWPQAIPMIDGIGPCPSLS